jgi:hypothetical protein
LILAASTFFATGYGMQNAGAASSLAKAATCQRVADILSDGPDPGVDPVGYALAQVLPLRQVKTTDEALHVDIENLASAYETVYKTNDKKGTEADVNRAGKKIDTICPGAF